MTTVKKYAVVDKAGEFIRTSRFDSGLYDTRREAELCLLHHVDQVAERETEDYGILEVDETNECPHGVSYDEQCQDCEEEEEGRMLDGMEGGN